MEIGIPDFTIAKLRKGGTETTARGCLIAMGSGAHNQVEWLQLQ